MRSTSETTKEQGQATAKKGPAQATTNGISPYLPSASLPRNLIQAIWRAVVVTWRVRGLWLALIGLGCALQGQYILANHQSTVFAIRWYAVGILLVLVAWIRSGVR